VYFAFGSAAKSTYHYWNEDHERQRGKRFRRLFVQLDNESDFFEQNDQNYY
jgi:hypothetical protein